MRAAVDGRGRHVPHRAHRPAGALRRARARTGQRPFAPARRRSDRRVAGRRAIRAVHRPHPRHDHRQPGERREIRHGRAQGHARRRASAHRVPGPSGASQRRATAARRARLRRKARHVPHARTARHDRRRRPAHGRLRSARRPAAHAGPVRRHGRRGQGGPVGERRCGRVPGHRRRDVRHRIAGGDRFRRGG